MVFKHLVYLLLFSAGCSFLTPVSHVKSSDDSLDSAEISDKSALNSASQQNLNVRALVPCVEPLMLPGTELAMPYNMSSVPSDSASFLLPAWMSLLAYRSEQQIRRELRFAGFKDEEIQVFDFFKPMEGAWFGLQAFVAQGDSGRFVVFRGSDSLFDWLSNFDTAVVPLPKHFGPSARVHNGFKELFESGYSEIKASLDGARAEVKRKPIWVIGHSLGGAQALLFGAAFAKSGLDVGAVVTLSQPRVGNLEFTKEIDALLGKRYVKLVRPLDIVPHTPSTVSAANLAGKFLTGAPIPQKAETIADQYQKSNYAHTGAKFALTDTGAVVEVLSRNDADDLEFFRELNRESTQNDGDGVDPVKKTALIAKRGMVHLPEGMFCLLAAASSLL